MSEFNAITDGETKPVATFDIPEEEDLVSRYSMPEPEPVVSKDDLVSRYSGVSIPKDNENDLVSRYSAPPQLTPPKQEPKTPNYQLLQDRLIKNRFFRGTTTVDGELTSNEDGTWKAPYVVQEIEGKGFFTKLAAGLQTIDAFIGQKTGRTTDSMWQDEGTRENFNKTINSVMEDYNLTKEEMETAWKDLQAIHRPMDEAEPLRTLSDGRILPNPANPAWLDTELAEATIRTSSGSEEEKRYLIENLEELQSNIALRQIEGFAMGNVSLAPTDMIFSEGKNWEGPIEWAKRQDREFEPMNPEFVKAYRKDVIDKRSLFDAYQSDATLGILKVANTIYGVGGLFGSEDAQEKAIKGNEATSLIRAGKRQTGILGSVIEETPSLAMQIGITIASGGIGSGLAGAAGLGATGAARASLVAGNMAAVSMSGMQSAAMTYGQLREQGMSHEEAKDKSIDAGVATGVITGIFQAAGLGGAESAMVRGSAANKVMRELYTATNRETLTKATGMFLRSLPKAYFGEATEEGLDEVVSSFLTSDPDTPIATAWKDAIHAAQVGGAIGVASHIVTGGFEKGLQLMGMNKIAETLATDVLISEEPSMSLAEARMQGIDPNSIAPSEIGADSTILKSKVNKKEGVSMARSGDKPTFLQTIFGPPSATKEYNADFDRSSDFELKEIPGTKLEAVVHRSKKSKKGQQVSRYTDKAYDHTTGTFVDLPADVRKQIESGGVKVYGKESFETDFVAPEPAITEEDMVGLEEDLQDEIPMGAPPVASTQSLTPNVEAPTDSLPEGQTGVPAADAAGAPTFSPGEQVSRFKANGDTETGTVVSVDGDRAIIDVNGKIRDVPISGLTTISRQQKPDETKTESSKSQPDQKERADNQEAPEQEDGQEVLDIDFDPTLSTSGKTTTPTEVTVGTRIHNTQELSKMVMAEDLEIEGQGVDPETGEVSGNARPQSFYMDSHESETKGGGQNENVTIGAMPVGTLVIGKGENGKATKAYRVMKTAPLKSGSVRHYLQPLFDKDTDGKLEQDAVNQIYATGALYQANSRELEVAAKDIIESLLKGKNKPDSPEVREQIKKLIVDSFTFMVGKQFTDQNVVFENIPDPMHVTVQNGKPVIKVNLDHYVKDFIRLSGRIDQSNGIGLRQVMYDLAEKLRIAGLEELVHHQVIVDWGLDTENGRKLSASVNQLLDTADANDHGKAELARSARWVFGAETKDMNDDQVVEFLNSMRDRDQDAFNQKAWQIGHEMLASLYSRMKVGKDAASMNAAAERWVKRMTKDGQSGGKVLVNRLRELADRYFQAIRDFFKAYESISHLPKEMIGLLRNLEDSVDKQGIRLPDAIGVQIAAVKQKMDVLAHPAVFAKDGYEYAQVQKQLREVVTAMRQVRNDNEWVPITIGANGDLIVTDEATPEEQPQIQELLDKLNSNKRSALTRRVMEASNDLNRMMTWLNRAPLTKKRKSEDQYGNSIEETVSNFRQILDQPINAVVKAFGPRETEDSVLEKINEALPKALQASMNITPEMLLTPPNAASYFEKGLAKSDAVGTTLLGLVAKARKESDLAEAEVEKFRNESEDAEETPEISKERRRLAKRYADADRKLQEVLINRDRYIRKVANGGLSEDVNVSLARIRAELDKGMSPSQIRKAIKKAEEEFGATKFQQIQALARELAREDTYRAYISESASPFNRPIQSIGELVSRRTSNPRMMDFAIRVAYPKDSVAEFAINEIESTSEIGGAVGRLIRFKDELNYMLMGGAKPEHMWSDFGFSDVGKNIAKGRLMSFSTLPELFKGRFYEGLMDVDAYDFTGQPEGVVAGREGFEFNPFTGERSIQALGRDLVDGVKSTSSLFGVEFMATGLRDRNGRKMTGADKSDLVSSNARYINDFLIKDTYEANRMGDAQIPFEVLATMGFSLPYGQTEAMLEGDSITRYPTYPDKLFELPTGFQFDESEGEWNRKGIDLIKSPQFTELFSTLVRYVDEAITPNPERTPSVFFHASGLTPAGLAFQAVAPKLLEFLAITKGWGLDLNEGRFSPYDVLTQDPAIKAAYDNLMPGIEKTKAIEGIRAGITSTYGITERFWELHRAANAANTIYIQSRQANPGSKSMSYHLKQASNKLPISVEALQSSRFVTNLLSRSSKPSENNSKTFISLLIPIRAQRAIDLYNSIKPEIDELVIRKQQSEGSRISQDIVGANEGDVVSRSSDFDLSDPKATPMAQIYGGSENSDKRADLIKTNEWQRQMLQDRLEKWRAEMLAALLGGNPDHVIQYIHSEQFLIHGTDENGAPTLAFDEEALDQSILDRLEKLREEEIERGVVIDSKGLSFKNAIAALKSRVTDENQTKAIELIENLGGEVQKSVGHEAVQIDPASFDADAYSLLTSIASSIPNLAFIEGKANWQLQKDGPPAMVFIPDAEAPTLIMPYGGKVQASNQELQSALADMFLWSARNGGADLIGNANRILGTLSFEGMFNPRLRKLVTEQIWRGMPENRSGLGRVQEDDLTNEQISQISVSEGLSESGAFDEKTKSKILKPGRKKKKKKLSITGSEVTDFLDYDYENTDLAGAVVESIASKIVDERRLIAKRRMDTRLDERIGQTVAGPLLLEALTSGVPSNLTEAQAAAVIVAALTDRSVQQSMLLSIRDNPTGNDPSPDKLASRGNLLSPSLLPGFLESVRNDMIEDLPRKFKVQDAQGRDVPVDDDTYASRLDEAARQHLDGTLQIGSDGVTMTNGEVLSMATIEQTEWLSKLLHQVMDSVEPRFTDQFDIDLTNEANEFHGTNSTAGKAIPKGLVETLPQVGITEMQARQIMAVMSKEHISSLIAEQTGGKGVQFTSDLMEMTGRVAEVVKQAYNRIVYMERGNRATEDAVFNYGTFAYDISLWSDNSRKSPYEASRIMKGAINEGVLDGGKTQMDGNGRDYIRVDSRISDILALRESNGRAVYVASKDMRIQRNGFNRIVKAGERLSRKEADEANATDPESAIQDLEYTRRKYFEEVDGFKAEIERLQDNANKAIDLIQAAREGLLTVDGLFEELLATDDQFDLNKMLQGSPFLDQKMGWFDAPQVIRAAFDEPHQLAGSIADNLIDQFKQGVSEIGEAVSFVPSAYSKEAGSQESPFIFYDRLSSPLLADEITAAISANPFAEAQKPNPRQVVKAGLSELKRMGLKTSSVQDAIGFVSTQEVDRIIKGRFIERLGSSLKQIREWNGRVPENDFGFGKEFDQKSEDLQRSFNFLRDEHNERVRFVTNQVNKRLQGLLKPEQFLISSPDDASAAFKRFSTLLEGLSSPAGLHLLLKDQSARKAIAGASLADEAFNDRLNPDESQEPISSFDQLMSKGKGMLAAMDNVQIGREAALLVKQILMDDSITDKKSLIVPIIQQDLFPLHGAATVARTQLRARMEKVMENKDAAIGANLAMEALSIAEDMFKDLPRSLKWGITRDVVRDLINIRSNTAEASAMDILRRKSEMEAKYAYRRNEISAPRANHASRMVYDGTPDNIEILRRNHLDRGLDWSRNTMALKKVKLGKNGQVYDQSNIDGMEDALDRMSRADILAATATVISQIESKKYDVVGNLVAPTGVLNSDGTSVIPLATSGYSLANDVSAAMSQDDTDAVKEAKTAYDLLMSGPFFSSIAKKKNKIGDRLTGFDPIERLKENLLRVLINSYNAFTHEGFDNLGNHPSPDLDGNTKVRESIKVRLGPILKALGPNSTAAQIKDLMDIHSEIVSEVLAARTAHDIALGIVDGSRMDAGLVHRYLLNHDPSVRKAFAGNAKGRQGAMDALGFIDYGATGHTGRNGYTSTKNAWSELFTAEEKKLKGPNKFEDAAAGVMFHRVIDFLSATGKTSQERAQTLLEMFQQADDGFSDALSASRLTHIKGNTIKDVLRFPIEKFNDPKNDLTQETFEMLQQRKVYESLRDYWKPRLEMVVGGKPIDDLKVEAWGDLSQQAKNWGDFVKRSMEHINSALQVSAMMNGMIPEEFLRNRATTPFRWRVFGREHQSTQQFPDYEDVLAIDRASYRQSPTRKPKPGEIHMLDISGFTGPLHVIDDALHRMMMVDAYSTFKQFAGVSVTTDKNKRTLTKMGSLYHHGQRITEDADKELAHAASARLASLGQDIVHKDVFTVTDKSMLMDGVQQVARHGAVKALLSVKQIYAQVLPGLMSYSFIREGLKGNADFVGLFSKIVYSMVMGRAKNLFLKDPTLRTLGDNVDQFALVHGPLVYKRTAGGEEEYHKAVSKIKPSTQNRTNRTFGDSSKAKEALFWVPNKIGQGVGAIRDLSDKMLHMAIANPESAFARSVFAHQIWKMVNQSLPEGEKVSFEDFVDPVKGKEFNITPQMKKRAETMVNDMIASTDRAKKAELLQQSDNAANEMVRGLFATFANHPLHTWGNSRAGMSMIKHGDEESKVDGRRLIASNVFQNVLFQLTRIEIAAQILGYAAPLIAAAFTDMDEEDRDEMRKRIVGSLYGINEDGSRKDGMAGAMRYLTTALGSSTPLGYKESKGWDEADMDSDMANLATRVVREGLVQVIPGAATTLGSKGLEKAVDAILKATLDPDGKFNFERAGVVFGEGPRGDAPERLLYNTTKAYRNYLSDLSYFTIGLDSLLDPLTRLSNATGDITPLPVAGAFAGELPILPRDFRPMIEKETDESLSVRKWSSFWEKAAKPKKGLGF